MTLDEYLLVHLMEECAEVSQRASKQLRFGRDEVQPEQPYANHERLRDELMDVMAMVRKLQEARLIEPITAEDLRRHGASKFAKIQRMLELSRSQGRLTESEEPRHE